MTNRDVTTVTPGPVTQHRDTRTVTRDRHRDATVTHHAVASTSRPARHGDTVRVTVPSPVTRAAVTPPSRRYTQVNGSVMAGVTPGRVTGVTSRNTGFRGVTRHATGSVAVTQRCAQRGNHRDNTVTRKTPDTPVTVTFGVQRTSRSRSQCVANVAGGVA